MHPFEAYLKRHQLDALTVSTVAGVRYTIVWNATRGHPIAPEHSQQIRQAVLAMTGIPFTGDITLRQPIDQLPTLPIRKIPRHNPF
jgi:hypothetical protein